MAITQVNERILMMVLKEVPNPSFPAQIQLNPSIPGHEIPSSQGLFCFNSNPNPILYCFAISKLQPFARIPFPTSLNFYSLFRYGVDTEVFKELGKFSLQSL